MKKVTKFTSAVIALVMMLSLAACSNKTKSADVVATVNGKEITRERLDKDLAHYKQAYKQQGADLSSKENESMLKYLESQVLDGLIEEELIYQQAEKEKLVPSDKDVEAEIKSYKSKFGSKEEFDKTLKNFNWTEEFFKEKVKFTKTNEKLRSKVTKDIKVTDEDVRKFYESNKALYKEPEQVRARHILTKFDTATTKAEDKVNRTEAEAKKIAEGILKQLKGGADFAKLAAEKSEDPGSKSNGGEYTFKRGQMVKEFEDAAFALKPGEMTKDLVKTEYGFHIIKLEEIIPAKDMKYEDIKDKLEESLLKSRQDAAFNEYIAKISKSAKIDRKLPKAEMPQQQMGTDTGTKPVGHP